MEHFRLVMAENQLVDRTVFSPQNKIHSIGKDNLSRLGPDTHKHKGSLNWTYRLSAQAMWLVSHYIL